MYIHTQPTYILPISSLLIGNSEIGQDFTVITTLKYPQNAKYTKEKNCQKYHIIWCPECWNMHFQPSRFQLMNLWE